jgi:hypothetical protein
VHVSALSKCYAYSGTTTQYSWKAVLMSINRGFSFYEMFLSNISSDILFVLWNMKYDIIKFHITNIEYHAESAYFHKSLC